MLQKALWSKTSQAEETVKGLSLINSVGVFFVHCVDVF